MYDVVQYWNVIMTFFSYSEAEDFCIRNYGEDWEDHVSIVESEDYEESERW